MWLAILVGSIALIAGVEASAQAGASTLPGVAVSPIREVHDSLAAQFITVPPGIPAPGSQPQVIHAPWSHTVEICLGIVIAAFVSCLLELRWMASRQEYLRRVVLERTSELEAEKAELLKTKAALVQLASHDSLTGIFNRAAILDLLENEILCAKRERTSAAVILADLDNFKQVNDRHGHLAGDAVLREFAQRIQSNTRIGDYVGRYGGEEVLILLGCLPDRPARRIADLHRRVTQPAYMLKDGPLHVTSSFGVAWFDSSEAAADSLDTILNLADRALYRAKARGKNRIEFANSPHSLLLSRSTDRFAHPAIA